MILLAFPLVAQHKPEIQNIQFYPRNDTIVITFDFLNSKKKELFDVSIQINTTSGKLIRPRSISGDVGDEVTGGKGKTVYWDLNRDQVFINEKISVDIEAIPLGIPERFVSRGRALWMSALVPGLGISKLNKGGPYWIMAIATYGAAVGSAVFYYLADDNYHKYLESLEIDERNALHSKVESQNNISDVLMYTAGVVWLGNMIWTLAHPNKTKNAKGLDFGGSYEPIIGRPVFAVRYRF